MVNKHLVFCHLLQSSILVPEPHGKQLLEKTSRWRKHPLRVFLPVTSHDTIGWSINVWLAEILSGFKVVLDYLPRGLIWPDAAGMIPTSG